MERLLKVLLTVDNNSYKITIKTKTSTNGVPFADFKHFVYDKHKALFADRSYVWKIFDSDFGEFVTLEDNTFIYDLSKIRATSLTGGGANEPPPQRASFENSRQMTGYGYERTPQPANIMPQPSMVSTPMRHPAEVDLRDFVSAYQSPAMHERCAPNSFKTYYSSNQPANIPRQPAMSSRVNADFLDFSPQTSGVMSGYNFQSNRGGGQRDSNPYLNPNPQSHSRILSPPAYFTNLPPTVHDRFEIRDSYDNYSRRGIGYTGNVRKKTPLKNDNPNRVLSKNPIRGPAKRETPKSSKTTPKPNPVTAKSAAKKDAAKPREPEKPLKKFNFDNLESKEKIVKAMLKYNDEFVMISMCEDDIWKTTNIWNFVAKEVCGQSDDSTIFDIKKVFKEMLKKYVLLFDEDVVMSAADMKKLCPFFDYFHKKLDLKPFHKDVEKLKEANIFSVSDAVTSSDDKDVEMLAAPENSDQANSDVAAIDETANDDQEKFDEKQDVFLLMAVSSFITDFGNELVLEDEVWSKVAKEVNESADEAESTRFKQRFYHLLKQYKKLGEKKDQPLSSDEKTLKFLFAKLDTTPFEKPKKKQEAEPEAEHDCLVLAQENEELLIPKKLAVVDSSSQDEGEVVEESKES